MRKLMLTAAIATVIGVGQAAGAAASALKVVSGPATAGLLEQLAPRFEKETGYQISKEGGVTGVLKELIANGEPFDLAIIPAPLIETFAKEGKIAPNSGIALVRVGVGVAVRSGAAKPDVSSVLALKQTLLKAKSITLFRRVRPRTSLKKR
jgi:molybdate transport system substrate-binding protein